MSASSHIVINLFSSSVYTDVTTGGSILENGTNLGNKCSQ